MSKRTLALIIVLAIVTVVLIFVALSPKQEQQEGTPRILPTVTPSAQSILEIGPNPLVTSTQSVTADVMVDSGENKVTAVQLELSFDPTKISNITITPGTLLENPVILLNNIDYKEGRISYAIGISPTGTAKAGTGTVATITLQTALLNGEQTAITVLPKSLITAEGISSSVLKEATGTTITFTQPTSFQPQPTISQ